eukprot:1073864-Pyramimonas_sp.AAC.1
MGAAARPPVPQALAENTIADADGTGLRPSQDLTPAPPADAEVPWPHDVEGATIMDLSIADVVAGDDYDIIK